MRVFLERDDGSTSSLTALDEVDLATAKLVWIDMAGASAEEFQVAGEFVGAHPVSLNYCLRPDGLPKVEEYPEHLFIAWSFMVTADGVVNTSQVSFFLGHNYLLTTCDTGLADIDEAWDKLTSESDAFRHSPAEILYYLLDNAVDEYFPVIEDITESIDSYQDLLLSGDVAGGLEPIIEQKHRNAVLRKVVAAHRDVILKLERRDMPFIPKDMEPWIMDIYDLLARAGAAIEANAEQITSSMDIHLNMVSNRLNEVMKKLTIVATIFLPLTFLVGLYGMNFKHMPELSWRYGYLAAWIALLVIGIATYFLARWVVTRPARKMKRGDKIA